MLLAATVSHTALTAVVIMGPHEPLFSWEHDGQEDFICCQLCCCDLPFLKWDADIIVYIWAYDSEATSWAVYCISDNSMAQAKIH